MIGMRDRDYLIKCGSPALPLLKQVNWGHGESIRAWYRDLIKDTGGIEIGVAFYKACKAEDERARHAVVTEGMSEKGRQSFLKNAMVIACKDGDLIAAEHDGGKAFGVIQHGMINFGRMTKW
jgi:hypothetical protein